MSGLTVWFDPNIEPMNPWIANIESYLIKMSIGSLSKCLNQHDVRGFKFLLGPAMSPQGLLTRALQESANVLIAVSPSTSVHARMELAYLGLELLSVRLNQYGK